MTTTIHAQNPSAGMERAFIGLDIACRLSLSQIESVAKLALAAAESDTPQTFNNCITDALDVIINIAQHGILSAEIEGKAFGAARPSTAAAA